MSPVLSCSADCDAATVYGERATYLAPNYGWNCALYRRLAESEIFGSAGCAPRPVDELLYCGGAEMLPGFTRNMDVAELPRSLVIDRDGHLIIVNVAHGGPLNNVLANITPKLTNAWYAIGTYRIKGIVLRTELLFSNASASSSSSSASAAVDSVPGCFSVVTHNGMTLLTLPGERKLSNDEARSLIERAGTEMAETEAERSINIGVKKNMNSYAEEGWVAGSSGPFWCYVMGLSHTAPLPTPIRTAEAEAGVSRYTSTPAGQAVIACELQEKVARKPLSDTETLWLINKLRTASNAAPLPAARALEVLREQRSIKEANDRVKAALRAAVKNNAKVGGNAAAAASTSSSAAAAPFDSCSVKTKSAEGKKRGRDESSPSRSDCEEAAGAASKGSSAAQPAAAAGGAKKARKAAALSSSTSSGSSSLSVSSGGGGGGGGGSSGGGSSGASSSAAETEAAKVDATWQKYKADMMKETPPPLPEKKLSRKSSVSRAAAAAAVVAAAPMSSQASSSAGVKVKQKGKSKNKLSAKVPVPAAVSAGAEAKGKNPAGTVISSSAAPAVSGNDNDSDSDVEIIEDDGQAVAASSSSTSSAVASPPLPASPLPSLAMLSQHGASYSAHSSPSAGSGRGSANAGGSPSRSSGENKPKPRPQPPSSSSSSSSSSGGATRGGGGGSSAPAGGSPSLPVAAAASSKSARTGGSSSAAAAGPSAPATAAKPVSKSTSTSPSSSAAAASSPVPKPAAPSFSSSAAAAAAAAASDGLVSELARFCGKDGYRFPDDDSVKYCAHCGAKRGSYTLPAGEPEA